MNIQLDQISNVEALIKINLEETDYQPKVEAKLREYSKKAQIKGFRPGKVPRTLIQKMYGESILIDEVNHLVSHKVMDYIKENEIQILGEPLPNIDKVRDLDWKSTKSFDFEYNIGIAQGFDLTVDKKVKVETYSIKVDQDLVKETVDSIKKQFGESTNPEVSEAGDSLYGTILSEEEGEEGYGGLIDISDVSSRSQKDFIGVKAGDVIEFDPTSAIKDDEKRAQLVGDDNKDKKGKIKFEVKNINRVTPAELSQELFDKTFGKDLVKSEDEFTNKVKETLAENYNKETDSYTDLKIKDKLIEKTKIDLPDTFLKRWLERSNDKLTKEEIDKDYPLYVDDLKWSMIKNKLAKENNIKAEHDDVVNEAKNMIRAQFGAMGMSEALEANIDHFAQNYLQGEEGQNYMKLHEKVFNDRVIAYIRENITLKVKEVTLDEYKKKA